MTKHTSLLDALSTRFGDLGNAPSGFDLNALTAMATRGSCRSFKPDPVPSDLLRILCATALSSPTKSDLQQRDIVELRAAAKRRELAALIPDQTWVQKAPAILIFCGNNRRQRLLHDWHSIPFANDHFDAVFNAIADAAIALGAFVTAAEAIGLGCCPISAVRNEAQAVSDMLDLPDHVFPFAGLAVGYPAQDPQVSMRLRPTWIATVKTACERLLGLMIQPALRIGLMPHKGSQKGSERPRIMAGLRTKPGNTACLNAKTSVRSFARRLLI